MLSQKNVKVCFRSTLTCIASRLKYIKKCISLVPESRHFWLSDFAIRFGDFHFLLILYFLEKNWIAKMTKLSWKYFEQRNWVFATNSNMLIPMSLQPDGVCLWYFKLRILDLTVFIVWNIKDLRRYVAKI